MCCKILPSANVRELDFNVTETAAAFCAFAFENTSKNSKAREMLW